jgi:NAD(P)-dependent dehydrogenase (short-subunit alcohol dehydrogenase family)
MVPSAQTAIVTGARSGIGAAIAQHLAGAGFHVVAIGRREPALRETAASAPQKISVKPLDVGEHAAVDRLVEAVVEARGRIDVLVNYAGTNTVDRAQSRGVVARVSFPCIVFSWLMILMLVIGEISPRETEFQQEDVGAVDMTPWKHARAAGIVLIIVIFAIYITFADFSVLTPSGS